MKTTEERFLEKAKLSENGCLEWTKSKTKDGYGKFRVGRKTVAAHRVSYLLFVGQIPEGMWVLHKCDNRLCVNHVHLFLGNRQDNMDDMVAKGRARSGNCRGADNGRAKLEEDLILAIMIEYEPSGSISQNDLADKYGISQTQVSRIVRRESWSHINVERQGLQRGAN